MKRTQFESKNISPPPRNSGQVLVYEACFVNHFLLFYFVIAGTPENYTIRYKNAGTENTARRYLPVPKEPPNPRTQVLDDCWYEGTNHGYRVLDDLSA